MVGKFIAFCEFWDFQKTLKILMISIFAAIMLLYYVATNLQCYETSLLDSMYQREADILKKQLEVIHWALSLFGVMFINNSNMQRTWVYLFTRIY